MIFGWFVGETYVNKCTLMCAGFYRMDIETCLTKVYDGPCDSPECICTDVCNYVCGSDGKNYFRFHI